MKHWDVVIIGGGLSGLVAANLLAREKSSVLVLEKGIHVGGRAKTDCINDQLFNIGPHAFYKKGKAKPILEQLGVELHGKTPKLNGLLIDNEVSYAAPYNPIDVFTTRYFNWKDRLQYLNALIKILNARTELLSPQTFSQWVKQVSPSPAVQSVLLLLGRLSTYCNAPDQVSAKIVVSQLQSVMNGVLYLDGGWQTLIDQLHNKAVLLGAEIQTHSTVKKITPLLDVFETGFEITVATGDVISTKNILSTTSPLELLKMLGEHVPPTIKDFFTQIIPVRGATLDVALTKLPEPTKLFALGIHAPLYYSVHSTYARLSNNSTNIILHVFKYLQPNEQVDPKVVKKELGQFLETIQPGWKQFEVASRFIPHITVNERLPLVGDDVLLESSKTVIPGLYIAGDWASTDSILSEAAVTSAKQAAFDIIQKERVENFAN